LAISLCTEAKLRGQGLPARTAAGSCATAALAAAREKNENPQTLLNQGMALLAFDMRDKTHPARVVFVCWIV